LEDVVVQPMSAVDVLNDTMSGVARPLRSRIAQVVGALACRSDEYDDDNGGGGGTRNDDGGGGDDRDITSTLGTGVGGGSGGAMEEEASSARVRLASLYSVCGLLLFYHSAMKKAVNKLQLPKKKTSIQENDDDDDDDDDDDANDLSKNNPIVRCLIECIQEATQAYAASLKVHNALLNQYAVSSNTSPAEVAHAAIVRLCNVRTASPGFDDEILGDIASSIPASSSSSQSDSIGTASSIAQYLSLEYLCETIIEGVLPSIGTNTNTESSSSMGIDSRAARLQLDDASSIKAAVAIARKAGLRLTAGTKWDTIVKQREELLVEELIIVDTKEALDECGLGSIQKALESMRAVYIDGMSMASHPGLSRAAVEKAMKMFYGSLYDMPFPDYEGIKDPVLRKHARTKLAKNVADVYGELYGIIRGDDDDGHDGAECYGDLSFLEHTPEGVGTLLTS